MEGLKVYTLEDIENIIFSNYSFKLDNTIKDIVNNLEKKVSAPNYVKTPNFKKRHNEFHWSNIRNFKVKKIIETKDKLDEVFNSLREMLNKLTNDNFESTSEKIIDLLKKYDMNDENKEKICNLIFDTSSRNGFYSEVYANLCNLLVENIEELSATIKVQFDNYKEIFDSITYVNPDENYDEFCLNNKKNDMRISVGKFFTNLMNHEIISEDNMFNLLTKLQNTLYNNQNDSEKKKINDIYVENIFNILKVGYNKFKTHDTWSSFYEKVGYLSSINNKEHRGISNKCIFTYMDIVDYLKNQQ